MDDKQHKTLASLIAAEKDLHKRIKNAAAKLHTGQVSHTRKHDDKTLMTIRKIANETGIPSPVIQYYLFGECWNYF